MNQDTTTSALTRSDVRGMLADARSTVERLEGEFDVDAESPELDEAIDRVERLEAMLRDPELPGTRTWRLIEGGFEYSTVEAEGVEDALEEAVSNVDAANYPDEDGARRRTMWIAVRVICDETGEEASDTVTVEPEVPACPCGVHEWESPHEIVGGIEENPGVRGHGGGVVIHEVCTLCGCGRVTDTWAQRPDTGEQGLTSVSYDPDMYSSEVSEIRRRVEREADKAGAAWVAP